jgi:hypothetical protein
MQHNPSDEQYATAQVMNQHPTLFSRNLNRKRFRSLLDSGRLRCRVPVRRFGSISNMLIDFVDVNYFGIRILRGDIRVGRR